MATTTKTTPTADTTATSSQATPTTKDTQKKYGISDEVKGKMSEEINEMLSFAVYNGITINTDVVNLIQNCSVDNLVNAHNMLCKNIAPATPKSIAFTKKLREKNIDKSLFSKLPLVRNLIILAIIFLVTFIVTGSTEDVNNESLDLGVMNNHGVSLLLNLAYLASISGLGVVFYLLKNVSTSVKNGNLVPEDTIYYIALIVLGVISGLIMSEILNFYTKDPESINLFNKSVLALIGGFSSDAIFSVLQGLIDRLKAIFAPSNSQ
ncbi:hypothetical protein [uncultured Dokdonia sp.]|uniref:hypothetical protein n=1 Tax=uncultured Dokdonia sp. TaxID=575653 RepID=UPI002631E0E2|nr:hypothetical protein [uncultured Dokdonia sp.]